MSRDTSSERAPDLATELARAAVAVAGSRHNLPALATRVVGRNEVIDLLREEVESRRLVSIVGAGGIGKTTVALAVAERALPTFADGVWLVDFAPLRDPALVPHAIASATGLTVHSSNVLAALCRFVRQRQLLLVLDNCEHMTEAVAACVAQILHEASNVHVLTTSRAALRTDGEHVYRLLGLTSPTHSAGLTADGALAYSAIELFVERATDRLETFVLGDDDAPTVAEICRSLDGIALAIELAAMRIDAFGVRGLQKQLDDRFRLLAGRRAGLERHRTLAATLDWSYSLLSEREASLLRAVSVFTGAFRLRGAVTVADVGKDEATAILAELASKSLLAVEADAVDMVYRPLETTRAYCLEKLIGSGDEPPVRQRHAEYVSTILEQAATEWKEQLSRDWGDAYGSYLDDLRAALAWAGSDPARRALHLRLTSAGTLLWNHFSLTDESRVHLTQAIATLAELGADDTAVAMHLQLALAGAILYTRGPVPEARLAMRRALQIAEQRGDGDVRLRCLRLTGTYELFFGEHAAGIATLETFVAVAAAEDPSAQAEGETHLGAGELFVGRLVSARKRMERLSAQSSRDFNDARFARFQYSHSVNILLVLGHAQWLTGFPDAAARTAEAMVACARQAAHELSLSLALVWSSLIHLWLGREDDCSREAAMLDELVERHGILTWRPIATFLRGALAAARDPECADAIDALRGAVAEFRAIGHNARLPYFIAVLADALTKQARFDEAEAAIREAVQLGQVQSEGWCMPEILRIEAALAKARGRPDEAARLLMQSIAHAEEVGALAFRLRAASDLTRLWQAGPRRAEAKRMLQAAYDTFSEGFETRDLLVAAKLLADLP